jgi:arylsulfatase A-like enzyme
MTAFGAMAWGLTGCGERGEERSTHFVSRKRPNVILVMSDDQGWGDVGYNGNPVLKTPHLDAMARECIRFDRFYAGAPVCSPTRGSCLTGRHPSRYNIPWAGEYPLPDTEITLAEALKSCGYATAHFGKWHLGGLSRTLKQTYMRGSVNPASYSPPWKNGFDECFSTEAMMPTYNPYYHVGGKYGTDGYRHVQTERVAEGQRTGGFRWRGHYWTGPGRIVDRWLEGDDSKIVMDRSLDFIRRQSAAAKPFLALIWFHTPHSPVVAGERDRKPYSDRSIEAQHWYGCISAMDRQVGRLRKELRRLDIADNTIVWFCSDNGPSYIHNHNSAGPFRGKKATLYEGGIRVPAILEWPERLSKPRVVTAPCSTSDFYPTILGILGAKMPDQPQLDGIDVMPLVEGRTTQRPAPIAFQAPIKKQFSPMARPGSRQLALCDNRYKLLSLNGGKSYQLFDLIDDPGETRDLAAAKTGTVDSMKTVMNEWLTSCERSAAGKDYAGMAVGTVGGES